MTWIWAILSAIVTGLIIGVLVYGLFGGKDTSGVDWIRFVVEVVVAAVFVWIYVRVSGRTA